MKTVTIESGWWSDHVWPIGITIALAVLTWLALAAGG